MRWTKSRGVRDRLWDLVVVYYSIETQLLFIHSAEGSPSLELAQAVSNDTAQRLQGEVLFRALGRIHRLRLHNVGITKRGRRDLRYSSFSGVDVGTALEQVQRAFATKSLLKGGGFESGVLVSVGVSAKGKIWSASRGMLTAFPGWCDKIGRKLNDGAIDTAAILRTVLVPVEVTDFPIKPTLAFLWPDDLLQRAEDNVLIGGQPIHQIDITLVELTSDNVTWAVDFARSSHMFRMVLDDANGHSVSQLSGPTLRIEAASTSATLASYFDRHPPVLLFLDGTELEGSFLSQSSEPWDPEPLPPDHMEAWSWLNEDIQVESIWRHGVRRERTVQERVARSYQANGYTVVFDDDDPGEAADLVCIKETDNSILLHLVHCKFSGGARAGARVDDLDKICQQAIRSGVWAGHSRFKRLCGHLENREALTRENFATSASGRHTRFIAGDMVAVRTLEQASRIKYVQAVVIVVQPGVTISRLTAEHRTVLAAAQAFLMQTAGTVLRLVGNEQ